MTAILENLKEPPLPVLEKWKREIDLNAKYIIVQKYVQTFNIIITNLYIVIEIVNNANILEVQTNVITIVETIFNKPRLHSRDEQHRQEVQHKQDRAPCNEREAELKQINEQAK